MGIPPSSQPDFMKAIEKVANACEKNGKSAGGMVITRPARLWKDLGFRAFAYLVESGSMATRCTRDERAAGSK